MIVTQEEFETQLTFDKERQEKRVVFVALPNCSHCEEYEPIFASTLQRHDMPPLVYCKIIAEQGSKIKRMYLKAEKGERIAAPATLFFESGEMVRRHFGKMTAEQLTAFIKGEEVPKPKEKTLADLTLAELHEMRCKQKFQAAEIEKIIAAIEWEISKR